MFYDVEDNFFGNKKLKRFVVTKSVVIFFKFKLLRICEWNTVPYTTEGGGGIMGAKF